MTVTKSRLEEAVEALPALSQQRMARLCLAGWRFNTANSTQLWCAFCVGKPEHMAGELFTLLERMMYYEDDHS